MNNQTLPTYTTTNFDNAKDFLNYLSPLNDKFRNSNVLYRGQADANWTLTPTVFRRGEFNSYPHHPVSYKFPEGTVAYWDWVISEVELLQKFLSYCNEAGIDVPANTSALHRKLANLKQGDRGMNLQKLLSWPDNDVIDALGFAQHYSLPTRMLDWTKHAQKAAYFALEGMNSPARVFDKGRLAVWILDCDLLNGISHDSHTVRVVDLPSTLNRNIVAQSGRFTVISGVDIARDLDDILIASGNSAALEKATLPWSENNSLIQYLDGFGINESTIYPNAYGAARAAKRSFRIDQ